MEKIINAMRKCGWSEVGDRVQHPVHGAFNSWEDAVVACIEVASD